MKPLEGPWNVWAVVLTTTHFTKAEALKRALALRDRYSVKNIGIHSRRRKDGSYSVEVHPPVVAEVQDEETHQSF
jgi:hypothetical protein